MEKNQEFEYFERKLPEFLNEHRGEFVLIKDKKVHGFYTTFEEALKKGYEKFGNDEFLIQEITDERRVNYINSNFISRVA